MSSLRNVNFQLRRHKQKQADQEVGSGFVVERSVDPEGTSGGSAAHLVFEGQTSLQLHLEAETCRHKHPIRLGPAAVATTAQTKVWG